MLSSYPACFIKEENGYSVLFPDLDNLATCGETLDEAFRMAADCLACYLKWLDDDMEEAPVASTISNIDISAIAKELSVSTNEIFVHLITVDVIEYAKTHFEESIEKNITIPTWLNNAAIEQDIDFSQALQEALKTKLHLT